MPRLLSVLPSVLVLGASLLSTMTASAASVYWGNANNAFSSCGTPPLPAISRQSTGGASFLSISLIENSQWNSFSIASSMEYKLQGTTLQLRCASAVGACPEGSASSGESPTAGQFGYLKTIDLNDPRMHNGGTVNIYYDSITLTSDCYTEWIYADDTSALAAFAIAAPFLVGGLALLAVVLIWYFQYYRNRGAASSAGLDPSVQASMMDGGSPVPSRQNTATFQLSRITMILLNAVIMVYIVAMTIFAATCNGCSLTWISILSAVITFLVAINGIHAAVTLNVRGLIVFTVVTIIRGCLGALGLFLMVISPVLFPTWIYTAEAVLLTMQGVLVLAALILRGAAQYTSGVVPVAPVATTVPAGGIVYGTVL